MQEKCKKEPPTYIAHLIHAVYTKPQACAMHNPSEQAWLKACLISQDGTDTVMKTNPQMVILIISDVFSVEFILGFHMEGNLKDKTGVQLTHAVKANS